MGQKHKADTKRPRRAPPAISPALAALAADRALDADTTAMRARINVAGAQPATRDGWLLVWEAIHQTCTPSAPAAHAEKPGRHDRAP
jgi:hypothetical protein